MNDNLDKLLEEEQSELSKIINKDYRGVTKEIDEELKEIYDTAEYNKQGKLTNEKEVNKLIKAITPLIATLWLKNSTNITKTSADLINTTYLFNEYVVATKIGNPGVVLKQEDINKAIKGTIKKRKKLIKWDKVIKGNARRLDKKVSKIIKKGLKDGKTEKQVQKKLEKSMKLNNGKAKSIARTETNTYISDSKLQVGALNETHGVDMVKIWVYTYRSVEARPSHVSADGQKVNGIDGDFNVGGKSTKAPQHFGDPSEDINCSCDMRLEYADSNVSSSIKGYNNYKEAK
ncbi:MAG: hypothetical protein KAX49_07265 [Halanaerobiales bacterium]|nr:hypothetical protein [Halanaerobiales bacterium]